MRKKILPDINQNDIKTTRKNYKMLKQIFFNFFLNGPGQAQLHVWTVTCEHYHKMKTGYFNTGFIFLRCKIQIDIKQNSDKKKTNIYLKYIYIYIYITIITTKIKNNNKKSKNNNLKKIKNIYMGQTRPKCMGWAGQAHLHGLGWRPSPSPNGLVTMHQHSN